MIGSNTFIAWARAQMRARSLNCATLNYARSSQRKKETFLARCSSSMMFTVPLTMTATTTITAIAVSRICFGFYVFLKQLKLRIWFHRFGMRCEPSKGRERERDGDGYHDFRINVNYAQPLRRQHLLHFSFLLLLAHRASKTICTTTTTLALLLCFAHFTCRRLCLLGK